MYTSILARAPVSELSEGYSSLAQQMPTKYPRSLQTTLRFEQVDTLTCLRHTTCLRHKNCLT